MDKDRGHSKFIEDLDDVLSDIRELLVSKNRKYGNSAINPIGIFAKGQAIELINARIDDKLTRIKNDANGEDEDLEKDLLGYLIIKKIAVNEMNKKSASTK